MGFVEVALGAIGLLLLACAAMLFALLRRAAPLDSSATLTPRFDALAQAQERTDRALAAELARSRDELASHTRHLREELGVSLRDVGATLDARLRGSHEDSQKKLDEVRATVDEKLLATGELLTTQTRHLREELGISLRDVSTTLDQNLARTRDSLDVRLRGMQEDNQKKLDEMRATVDEKLQSTIEQRLGAAFKQVSDRLEAVHKGLGEMQSLAVGVGDLKRVLTNVKTRGGYGETQLEALLEHCLAAGQYAKNVQTKAGSAERVDFAVRMPNGANGEPLWLPIDAKFPQEDYARLQDAVERGDLAAVDDAGRALETRVRNEAKAIKDKYVAPPHTTDFALLFLPTEGLYAEVLRRPALVEAMQRDHKVVLVGPTTLAAILNSLQMGFRTLAIEQRSTEVWRLLNEVKKQFGLFGDLLVKVDEKLRQASNTIGDATKRTRIIQNKLSAVESLPEQDAALLLPEATSPGEAD